MQDLNNGNFDFQNSESAGVLLDPNFAGTSDEEENENENENAGHNENENANHNEHRNQPDHENDDFSDEYDASSDSFDDDDRDPLDEYEEYDDFDQQEEDDADALMSSYVSDMINYLHQNSKDTHSSFLLADCPNLTYVEIGGFSFTNYASCTIKSFALFPLSF